MKFGLRHLALIVTTFAALGLNASALLRQPVAVNQATSRAALVVNFGNGRVVEQCVAFTEPEITGYDLLRRSILPVIANVYGPLGAAICKIDNEGCSYPAEDCFCKSVSEQKSWFFWVLQNGVWVSSKLGAGTITVTNGTVHGWMWGAGSPAEPVKTFDQICISAPTATPTSNLPNVIGGGDVITSVMATPLPSVVAPANVSATPAAAPTIGVTVVAVVAVPVSTSTPAAVPTLSSTPTITLVPTLTPESTFTSTPTFTPEPKLTSTITFTSTSTSTSTSTITSTSTFTPEPTPSSTWTSSSTITPTPTPAETPPNPLGYALFGVIALGLVGGIALTRMRR